MKQVRNFIAVILLLVSANAFSQTKKHLAPPPPPPAPEVKAVKPIEPEKFLTGELNVPPPPEPPLPPTPPPPPPSQPRKHK